MNTLQKTVLLLLFTVTAFGQNLKVMTYNLRFDNPADGENRWELRKEFLCRQIQFYGPDFFGTQEGKMHQLKYIDSIMTHYSYIGRGRDDSANQGEFSAIFYNALKFKVLKQSTFWLSETPEKVSKGWDAMFERICTYGLFENIRTKQRFYVFNTHFDHVGEVARSKSAKMIISKINAINTENVPVILTGDFNSEIKSTAYNFLSSWMNDSKVISEELPFGPTGTFNNFEFNKPVTLLIDYIFTSKDDIAVNKYAVLSDSKDCKYPSDHLPVYIELTLKK
ncbi:MAG: endonuclease/exonuclease/phosphatase [Flavobacterium sp. BFFFF1]|uniref:endonuclease/exonuclease/phosphatase family protein n=1 Tax=Flavobacterium sp. BFFFF1 TaxID=2015557 RepID=UPI000BCA9015|nr:endonuclease/exonuclease/phosphatase family protein [Flavobacterium sp. BFFFF1]OYU79646.1 MAG: endonuclease/exonuclease/phosphatase [Flavobacterium sp. BFFFF1]